ncbi:MAG TPA: ferritin-like fold-containing protein, partial [Actinomycetota bacterium]|nr:ferritin-like fold-containing protein [Actinomycetota bacterium]
PARPGRRASGGSPRRKRGRGWAARPRRSPGPWRHPRSGRPEPSDWLEAQVFHYVGDAMVRDFAEVLQPILDPVSAEVIRRTLVDRDEQEAFALDELTRGLQDDPRARDRIAAYARKVIGEALNQTRSALNAAEAVRGLLGGPAGEKEMLLDLLGRHRVRFDRLGIEPVE